MERSRGVEHLDVAQVLINLAAVRHTQRNYPEAEALLRRTINIQEKILGPGHPGYLTALRDYAEVLRKLKRTREAGIMSSSLRPLLPWLDAATAEAFIQSFAIRPNLKLSSTSFPAGSVPRFLKTAGQNPHSPIYGSSHFGRIVDGYDLGQRIGGNDSSCATDTVNV